MRRFWTCRSGNFAMMFAISIVPVLGATGMAIDYTRAVNVRSYIQSQVDGAALSGVQLGPDGNYEAYVQHVRTAVVERYGAGAWIEALQVQGQWVGTTDFVVSARGNVPVTILAAVPGFPDRVDVDAAATARIAEPRYVYKPPTVAELDPEAGDYNRIYVYCFDPSMSNDPETNGRTQMTAISDNGGSRYEYEMPQCGAGQMMSYRLVNVRDARTDNRRWDDPSAERYEYFTDTVMNQGAEQYDLAGWDILETVLCNTEAECRPRSQGGIIPEGKDRIPQRAKGACEPGKYMYYGWEDRPPGSGWTDRDYDDIRIIIACPEVEEVGDRVVRLVR